MQALVVMRDSFVKNKMKGSVDLMKNERVEIKCKLTLKKSQEVLKIDCASVIEPADLFW